MALINEQVEEMSSGFVKSIEASAVSLIMENLQKNQYQFPIKSTVREIVCNSIDSVADRNAAMDILTTSAPISKYYVEEKEGALFQDSKWNPLYYDPKWLSKDDQVYITYVEGGNQEKNRIIIEDNGTGLGGKRLEGYFNIGYSTKRLSRLPLGKFGIGAKSALSTGVQFYTVESRYNGMLFRFNIYNSRVDSIIPQYNLDNGTENQFMVFGEMTLNPYKAYWEPTTEKNGVKVTIETKKHHKAEYISAVQSQLLYFQNIVFRVQDERGCLSDVAYKAGILYEDEYLVLSDNNVWSKPHLLLNKVNYGYVNWEELEMEPKYGNIGIKVHPEDIEVNPSRESVIWSEETKNMVLARFNNVVDVATKFVQKELQGTDFIKWMRTCYQIASNTWSSSGSSIVARLANIIDITQVEPFFPLEPSIKFNQHSMFAGFLIRSYSEVTTRKANRSVKKVIREHLQSGLSRHSQLPILIIDAPTSVRRDKYLLQTAYTSGFIGIKAPDWIDQAFSSEVILTKDIMAQMELGYSEFGIESLGKKDLGKLQDIVRAAPALWKHLQASPEVVLYSSIEVPDSFSCSEEDEEEEIGTAEDAKCVKQSALSSEVRRKIEGKTVLHTPRYEMQYTRGPLSRYYTFDKVEVKVSDINGWDQEEIFYGNDADAESIQLAAFITREPNKEPMEPRREGFYSTTFGYNPARCAHYYDNPKLRLIKVAQNNNRLYNDFKHIQRFFVDIQNNILTMSNALLKWNTARLIGIKLNQAAFLWNFSTFDKERSEQFVMLCEYVKNNYNEVSNFANCEYAISRAAYEGLISHMDNLLQFQVLVNSNPSLEKLTEVAEALFGKGIAGKVEAGRIVGTHSVDSEVWTSYTDLLEYAQPIAPLLNLMPVLTGLDQNGFDRMAQNWDQFAERETCLICEEVDRGIREYLRWKGVS